jgi:cytoskeletal protein RodZ
MDQTGVVGAVSKRKQSGITLTQISESTKISVRSLQAIEDGDFKKLPGGVYNTNYIRQYARAIGFDESNLLAYYFEQTSPALSDPKNAGQPMALRDLSGRLA